MEDVVKTTEAVYTALSTDDAAAPGGPGTPPESHCRFCGGALGRPFLDLGLSPLSNHYLRADELAKPEIFYPLEVFFCERCSLVQLDQYETPEGIFGDYAYFSSYSDSWLQHARDYAAMARERFGLSATSQVVEIASNDGYLLRNFVEWGVPALGIEPARNVAEVARAAGVLTMSRFFGAATATELAEAGTRADLLIGNNVLAHVPDLNDFVAGMRVLLAPGGTITMEFPHLLQLLDNNQFDTIYHEHFSYFSLTAAERVLAAHGLTIYEVDEIPTHGGSLRIYARHAANAAIPVAPSVAALRAREEAVGLTRREVYDAFAERVRRMKTDLLEFFLAARREGKSVAAYGAPAKGNTLLNYCGVRSDFIDFTVDRNPHKQGMFLPGSRIPIYSPERIEEARPDYVCILPWNLKEEVMRQMSSIARWGGRFVVLIPTVALF